MGSGTSKTQPEEFDVASLPQPRSRDDCMLFSVVPTEEDLKRVSSRRETAWLARLQLGAPAVIASPCPACPQKGDVLLLEVGPLGFRLLRPVTEDPLSLYPWGQIHSWAHGDKRFTFRFFDDG